MNSNGSLTLLFSTLSLVVSLLVLAASAGLCFAAWRRSGYRADYGAIELLRLIIAILAVVLYNQPEWVEQFKPEQKPTIAVLWDNSRSMDTRDEHGASPGATELITRRESIAPLIEPEFWKSLDERLAVVIQPLTAGKEQQSTNLYDPLAQAPQKFKNLRAVVLASDGDWNEGK